MHAEPWLSLQRLNLTTSRSSDVIVGRCGGREAWTAPPCKGYLWNTDPGAPASCRVHARRRYSAENIQSDVCAEIAVSSEAMTIEVSQLVNQRSRKKGEKRTRRISLFFTFFFLWTSLVIGIYSHNHCQCSIWSLVSLQLQPEGPATPSSPSDKRSAIAELLKHDSCVSLTCIKCPRPLTFECYIAKEGSYFIYRSLILFLNICGALRPGSQSHYAL